MKFCRINLYKLLPGPDYVLFFLNLVRRWLFYFTGKKSKNLIITYILFSSFLYWLGLIYILYKNRKQKWWWWKYDDEYSLNNQKINSFMIFSNRIFHYKFYSTMALQVYIIGTLLKLKNERKNKKNVPKNPT